MLRLSASNRKLVRVNCITQSEHGHSNVKDKLQHRRRDGIENWRANSRFEQTERKCFNDQK